MQEGGPGGRAKKAVVVGTKFLTAALYGCEVGRINDVEFKHFRAAVCELIGGGREQKCSDFVYG